MISLLTQCDESEPVVEIVGFDGITRKFKQTLPIGIIEPSWNPARVDVSKTFDAARVALNNEGAF